MRRRRRSRGWATGRWRLRATGRPPGSCTTSPWTWTPRSPPQVQLAGLILFQTVFLHLSLHRPLAPHPDPLFVTPLHMWNAQVWHSHGSSHARVHT